MANYCILCVPKTERERVENFFFQLPENTNDIAILFQSEESICYYFAHNGSCDVTPDGAFKGYAIDYERKEILYSGSQHSPSVYDSLSGCYINVKNEAQSLVVDNDLFAQLPMLFFSEKGIVAVSDSLFMLAEIRKFFNISNVLHEPSGISRAWTHGIATYLLGSDTLIKNVHFCPPGIKLRVFTHEKMLRLQRERVFVKELFAYNVENYRESIRNCAENLIGGYYAIMNMENSSSLLSLSGGLDSRTILAACFATPAKKFLHISTNLKKASDCSVAHALAKKMEFSFSRPSRKILRKKYPMTNWFLCNAGIYDKLLGGGGAIENVVCTFQGLGAEVFKGAYNWRSLEEMQAAKVGCAAEAQSVVAKYLWQQNVTNGSFSSALKYRMMKIVEKYPKVQKDVSRAIYEEMRRGLLEVGITPEDNMATEWHSLCYGNPLHAGRLTQNTMHGYNFLMQKEMMGLTISPLNEYPRPKAGAPSVISDLLININPELACQPFDDAAKNMSQEYVKTRASYLLPLREVQPFTIVGKAQDVHSGTPKLFIDLAMKRGFHGDFTDDNIQKWVKQGYESLPSSLQQAFYVQKCIADNHTAHEMLSKSFLGGAAAKLMCFSLLD